MGRYAWYRQRSRIYIYSKVYRLYQPGCFCYVYIRYVLETYYGCGSSSWINNWDVRISRERLVQVRVDELRLRTLLVSEYDLSGVVLCGVINRKTRKLRQNLTSNEILLTILKHSFRSDHVIDAILNHLWPQFLRHWLIPREIQLHVMNTELDFKLLQSLLE